LLVEIKTIPGCW